MLCKFVSSITLLVTLASSGVARASEIKLKSKGALTSETRYFFIDDDESATKDINSAIVGRLELSAKMKPFKVQARGFARYDPTDVERSAIFAEDLYLEWKHGPLRVRAGAQMLNWTATEAFHPADIMNARYLDSNIENQEKIGEPMVAIRVKFLDGNVEFMYMPFVMDPILPSRFSRQNFAPAGVSIDDNVLRLQRGGNYVDRREFTYQFAGRIQQTIGDADVSLHAVSHIDRSTPQLMIRGNGTPALLFQPVVQYGGTYQQVFGGLIAKLEFAYRHYFRPDSGGQTSRGVIPDRPNFGLVGLGVEYGFVHEKGTESTLIVEGQTVFGVEGHGAFGTPSGGTSGIALPLFQRDLLVGYRYAFNDVPGREILITAIVDVEDPEEFIINGRYSQRLGDTFGVAGGVRLVRIPKDAPGPATGFSALNNDHQIYLNLTRYF